MLCEDTDEAEARLVAERVIEAFAKPFEIGDREVHQAASIGIAVQPRDGRPMDPEQVLRWADLAMYRAKAAGKSRYAMFEGWMGDGHPDRGGLERELRRGLADGELTVHYQPEVDLATGQVTGAEALVRWQHPERGLLEPAEFMFVAEDSDLIVAIDDFVLWQACHEAARWRARAARRRAVRDLGQPLRAAACRGGPLQQDRPGDLRRRAAGRLALPRGGRAGGAGPPRRCARVAARPGGPGGAAADRRLRGRRLLVQRDPAPAAAERDQDRPARSSPGWAARARTRSAWPRSSASPTG